MAAFASGCAWVSDADVTSKLGGGGGDGTVDTDDTGGGGAGGTDDTGEVT